MYGKSSLKSSQESDVIAIIFEYINYKRVTSEIKRNAALNLTLAAENILKAPLQENYLSKL